MLPPYARGVAKLGSFLFDQEFRWITATGFMEQCTDGSPAPVDITELFKLSVLMEKQWSAMALAIHIAVQVKRLKVQRMRLSSTTRRVELAVQKEASCPFIASMGQSMSLEGNALQVALQAQSILLRMGKRWHMSR
jgi:hypothetical protein